VGDGNLHLNVAYPGYGLELKEKLQDEVDQYIFDYIKKVKGSVSAEHGVGL
jgi:FAD/FMN-containing dehydrogenase